MINTYAGKTAFITGGASGIGLGMARAFGRRGMSVMLADIQEAQAQAAAEQLKAENITAFHVFCDVSDRKSVQGAAEATVRTFGKVHLVCNNAGVVVVGALGRLTDRDWDWMIDVNLKGVVYGVESFVPLIKAHGEGGHIVNTASIAALVSGAGLEPYSGAKAAVAAMSECWAMQLEPLNIGVSVMIPGSVRSRIGESARNRPERYRSAADKPPRERPQNLGIDADTAGERIVEAVRDGELYIFTDPRYGELIERRSKAIAAGLAGAAASEALRGVTDPGPLFDPTPRR
jgi:NAD(P)-dependent dehydrogenase (short-subunit alcohol dehydrogenase family)